MKLPLNRREFLKVSGLALAGAALPSFTACTTAGRSRRPDPSSRVTLGVIGIILWLVLAKPHVETGRLPKWLLTPGGLQSLLETMMPMP